MPDRFCAATPAERPADTRAERVEQADAFVAATGAVIRSGGNRACYVLGADRIDMPSYTSFRDTGISTAAEAYYATLLHELIHWTAPAHRCNRELGKRIGDHAYAREELIAELGAAFLCADVGITPELRADHASYIASWLTVLREDKRAIVSAASFAQKAANWLHAKVADSRST